MKADPKRMVQACRIYDALLRYYPISFQQEYGDTLAQHFRDEYREVLVSRKPIFRFWLFILIDFARSVLKESLGEGGKMIKKNIFVFCAIGVGLVTLFWSLWGMNSTYRYLHYTLEIPSFFEDLSWFLLFALGSLTLVGVTNAVHKNLLFRLPPILLLVGSLCLFPIPQKFSWKKVWGWEWLLPYLVKDMDEENLIEFFFISYLILILFIGIIALIRQKWLPGAALVSMIVIPFGLTHFLNWLETMIPSLASNDYDWPLYLGIMMFTSTWFVIAWWFYKENAESPIQGTLEEA